LASVVLRRTLPLPHSSRRSPRSLSPFLAPLLILCLCVRTQGKTVEVGRAAFETEKKRYTILDAPGHKAYVPNMIGGAAQADVGVLVVSARRGEFEAGFDRGGQTREHVLLAKTAGVRRLIIAINKMDDTTVNWDRERYAQTGRSKQTQTDKATRRRVRACVRACVSE
jgi:translation elongation factor EF-1alpha